MTEVCECKREKRIDEKRGKEGPGTQILWVHEVGWRKEREQEQLSRSIVPATSHITNKSARPFSSSLLFPLFTLDLPWMNTIILLRLQLTGFRGQQERPGTQALSSCRYLAVYLTPVQVFVSNGRYIRLTSHSQVRMERGSGGPPIVASTFPQGGTPSRSSHNWHKTTKM